EHNNVEYVMLQNIDENDDDDEEEEDKESILTNGHSKQVLSNETLIPMDHVEKT
ncbi:unnamed protein product, partial [Adineta steineri]